MVRDRGDVLLGWLTKLALGLAVLAVLGFDGVTVAVASVSVQDEANNAAVAARDSYAGDHDPRRAYEAAVANAKAADPGDVIRPVDFEVTRAGVVTLTLTRPIHTVVAHLLPTDKVRTARARGTAAPSD